MLKEITCHSRVQANRDLPNKLVKEGDKGTVSSTEIFDSELYLHIKKDDGRFVSPSCENCWDLINDLAPKEIK